MRIMIITDSSATVSDFAHCMTMMGHTTDIQTDFSEATQQAVNNKQDLVVVVDHDQFDGVRFVRSFREAKYRDPVMVISRDNREESRVSAFDAGADQVCPASADCDEWSARVRTLLRHCQPSVADVLTYGELRIDLARRVVTRKNTVLELRGKPYALLEYFMRSPGVVHSRERIAKSVWDQNFDLFSNVIEVTISKVRAQIDRDFDPPYLHTVSGHGYALDKDQGQAPTD